jgi:hypothetical protein
MGDSDGPGFRSGTEARAVREVYQVRMYTNRFFPSCMPARWFKFKFVESDVTQVTHDILSDVIPGFNSSRDVILSVGSLGLEFSLDPCTVIDACDRSI